MDDLINRQAAIDALDAICDRECEYPKKQRAVMCASCHLGSAFDVIDELPSAQPERKRGKWIYLTGLDAFECSVCGRQMVRNIFDYCPWCGSKMKGEEDE